jgi:long-chain acyl-CoA synthetase
MGYYHDEKKTKEAIDKDGWLLTGDVGALSAKTRGLSVIDRKKNIFKLQQGEYVAAEKVENTYLKGDQLQEIYIHGDSTETFVVAIAVPHRKFVEEFAAQHHVEGTYEQLCASKQVRVEFVNYLAKIGKEAGLQSFEQAKNIFLDTEPFLSRGILTNTMKIQRHEAKKFFRPQIDQLYKEGILKL